MKLTEVARELGKRWHAADPEVKDFYSREAQKDKERYYRVRRKNFPFLSYAVISVIRVIEVFLLLVNHQVICSLCKSSAG